MKSKAAILCLLALVALSGVAFGLQQRARAARAEAQLAVLQKAVPDVPEERTQQPLRVEPAPLPVSPHPASVQQTESHDAALQERVAQLEGLLFERDNQIRSLQAQVTAATTPARESAPTAEEPQGQAGNWLENLRENDPERYQWVVERRSEARERLQSALEDKSEFLFARERPWIGPDSMDTYEEMAQVIEETWALAEAIDAEDLNRDERRALRSDLMRNLGRLGPMLEAERDREFHSLAVAFGYNDTEAWEFVNYLNQVNELTSLRPLYQGLWGGRRMGPGRGGER